MIYSEAERKEIERVYGVFKDYIHASKFLDFVWSEKLGYLLLHIDPTKNTIEEDQIITSADELCAEQQQKYLLLTQPIHTKCGRLLLRMILNHAIHDGII